MSDSDASDQFTRASVRFTMQEESNAIGEKFDRLARRLGVEPHDDPTDPTWLVHFGVRAYDVFLLVGVLLDRIEDAEQRIAAFNPDALLDHAKEVERRVDELEQRFEALEQRFDDKHFDD